MAKKKKQGQRGRAASVIGNPSFIENEITSITITPAPTTPTLTTSTVENFEIKNNGTPTESFDTTKAVSSFDKNSSSIKNSGDQIDTFKIVTERVNPFDKGCGKESPKKIVETTSVKPIVASEIIEVGKDDKSLDDLTKDRFAKQHGIRDIVSGRYVPSFEESKSKDLYNRTDSTKSSDSEVFANKFDSNVQSADLMSDAELIFGGLEDTNTNGAKTKSYRYSIDNSSFSSSTDSDFIYGKPELFSKTNRIASQDDSSRVITPKTYDGIQNKAFQDSDASGSNGGTPRCSTRETEDDYDLK